jgi:hypothetical protein
VSFVAELCVEQEKEEPAKEHTHNDVINDITWRTFVSILWPIDCIGHDPSCIFVQSPALMGHRDSGHTAMSKSTVTLWIWSTLETIAI